MPAMNEAEVYQYLTKDGDSVGTIKKNTEMLRQHFTIESQRVAHALSQLDPYNQERHAAEAQRIYHENNGVLDRVLMQIASTSPQQMPLPIEAINKASEMTGIPKDKAKAVLSIPVILIAAFPAALLYTIGFIFAVGLVGFILAIINALTLKIDFSGMINPETVDSWLVVKVLYWIAYALAAIYGFAQVRGGGGLMAVVEELFLDPVLYILEVINSFLAGVGKMNSK